MFAVPYVPCVTCHMSRATCHVSHVTCQEFKKKYKQMEKSGAASRSRVCYQRGLPCLVFFTNQFDKPKLKLLATCKVSLILHQSLFLKQFIGGCSQNYIRKQKQRNNWASNTETKHNCCEPETFVLHLMKEKTSCYTKFV